MGLHGFRYGLASLHRAHGEGKFKNNNSNTFNSETLSLGNHGGDNHLAS